MKFSVNYGLVSAVALASGAMFAAPNVTDVELVPQSGTRKVTVKYKLTEEPAVVTVDFTTNGISIGSKHIISVTGDVNRRIEPSDAYRVIHWSPDKDWPNHLITDNSLKAVVVAWATNAPPDYMAVDLVATSNVFYYVDKDAVPGGVTNDMYKTSMLLMRKVHAGGQKFRMGDRAGSNENPHWVMLSEDYYLGVYELTQGQWHKFATKNFNNNGEKHPAESFGVSEVRGVRSNGFNWPENGHAVDSTKIFGLIRSRTGIMVDFPTEAQWEFACRAGTDTMFSNGWTNMSEIGWYSGLTNKTQDVGLKNPNNWGFYDMHGNVSELCLDWWQAKLEGIVEDPVGSQFAADTTEDVSSWTSRGGSYDKAESECRSAARVNYVTDKGCGYDRRHGTRLWSPAIAP